jgi:hypothetical protein
MSRYRQSFNEALQQVEKWSKDVEVKATGEHAGKTIDQLKREVDALRGKSNNEKEMGGLLFAIRAKQGWKKGEGSTGVEEATQTKHERGEVKVDKAERGERKAGESEDDYEDRESGGKGGLRPNPFAKKKKQDDLDRDNEAQATRSKFSPTAEDNVTGIPVSKKMAGTTVPPKQAPASQRMDKSKNLMPAPGWKTRKAGNKAGQMTTASYDPENKFRPAAEEHNCDEVHPEVSHKDWISQKDEAVDTWHPDPAKDRKSTSMKHTAKAVAHHDAQTPKKKPTMDTRQAAAKIQDILKKQRERKAAQKESNLPPHLSKFLDKKGNPNPEAAKRMADGKKKRAVATKVKDVTPKGYGPNEEVELEAHPDAGVSLAVRRARKKKSAAQMKKDMQHADNLIKLGAGRRKEQELRGEENVGIDELSNELLGKYKKKSAAASSAAAKAGDHDKSHKRYKGINTATTLQFRNDAKKHEEVELAIMSLDHKEPHRKLKITQKGLDALRKDRDRPKVKTQVKITKKGRAAVEDMSLAPKGKGRKAAQAMYGVKEDLEFKVTIKGIPPFYVPAKTAAAVKQSLRRQLKHPDDIESIIRVTKAAQKIDYRKRAQGKSDEDDNKK